MVDSTPTVAGPPSTMKSMRPPRSSITCCGGGRRNMAGAVGGRRHDRPAERGRECASATGCCGTRTAMLSRPAVASSATGQSARFCRTSVSGPGQNAAASFSAAASNTASRRAAARSDDMGDQRIERRPALGGVEPRDGRRRWWRRRRGRRPSRSETRPARPRRGRRAASAMATNSAGRRRVSIFRVISFFASLRMPLVARAACSPSSSPSP